MASASLNVFGNNCNDLTAAETMMMVKERFIETYGPPRYTIGWGCSGGSYQQHQIADNYPGLLDGIMPGCSFPEVGFGTVHTITDARLLDHYFKARRPAGSRDEQQRAGRRVPEPADDDTATVDEGALRIAPDRVLPGRAACRGLRYDPANNPTGARCNVYDHTVNVYGRDPRDRVRAPPARQRRHPVRPDGAATPAPSPSTQFLDLNERIGGFDVDANIVPQRTRGRPEATRAAYRTGRLTNGGGGLGDDADHRLPRATSTTRRTATSTCATTRSRCASGWRRRTAASDNHVMLVEDIRYGLLLEHEPAAAARVAADGPVARRDQGRRRGRHAPIDKDRAGATGRPCRKAA